MKLLVLLTSLLFLIVSISQSEDSAVVKAARKERERRAKLTIGKVYTNKDVQEFVAKNPTPVKEGMEPETQSQPSEETDAADLEDVTRDLEQSEKYWRTRYREVSGRLQGAEKAVRQLQKEVDDLTRAFYVLSDAEQKGNMEYQRTEKLNDLQQAKRELEDAQTDMDNLEEEARKAGALPGWLREE